MQYLATALMWSELDLSTPLCLMSVMISCVMLGRQEANSSQVPAVNFELLNNSINSSLVGLSMVTVIVVRH